MFGGEGGGKPARHGEVKDDGNFVVGCRRNGDWTGRYDQSLRGLTEPLSDVARGRGKVFLLALNCDGEGSEESGSGLSCRKGESRTRRRHTEDDLAGERVRGTTAGVSGRQTKS